MVPHASAENTDHPARSLPGFAPDWADDRGPEPSPSRAGSDSDENAAVSAELEPASRAVAPAGWRSGRRRRPLVCWAAVLLWAAVSLAPRVARADDESTSDGDEARSRATWATLLLIYTAVGAATTGGAYLLRDNLFGRGIAVSAGSWGGLGLGAAAGYGLGHLHACESADCTAEETMPALVGGLVGAAAGTLAATWLTAKPGLSRPLITAAGMTPLFVFLALGTIFKW
jgi:hypothetical protein